MAKRSTERVLNDEIAAADVAVTKAQELAQAKRAAADAAIAAAHDAHNALVMAEARAVRARKALDAYLPLPFPAPEASPEALGDGSPADPSEVSSDDASIAADPDASPGDDGDAAAELERDREDDAADRLAEQVDEAIERPHVRRSPR